MKWIIMQPCLSQVDEIAYWQVNSDGSIPVIFDTKEDAWREIADDMITHLQDFIDGNRTLEDTDFDTDLYVAPVQINEDGSIHILLEMAGPSFVLLDGSVPIWKPD